MDVATTLHAWLDAYDQWNEVDAFEAHYDGATTRLWQATRKAVTAAAYAQSRPAYDQLQRLQASGLAYEHLLPCRESVVSLLAELERRALGIDGTPNARHEQVLALLKLGASCGDIASQLGISADNARQIKSRLAKAGRI